MKALSHRGPFGRWLLPLLLVLLELGAAGSARAAESQKQALVLYSTRRDAQIAVVGERDLPRIFADGLTEGLDYYSEYIDRARFPDPSYKAASRDFLRLKYRDHRFDVIVAIQDVALEFVGDNRNALFADTPVVYFRAPPAFDASPIPPASSRI
jgi:hypothetical protein